MTTVRTLSADSNIKCQRGRYGDPNCESKADIAEIREWQVGHTKGISFFYFCHKCSKAQKAKGSGGTEMKAETIKGYVTENIGRAKYVLNWPDGSKHKDGSEFIAIAIFKNKKKMAAYAKANNIVIT